MNDIRRLSIQHLSRLQLSVILNIPVVEKEYYGKTLQLFLVSQTIFLPIKT